MNWTLQDIEVFMKEKQFIDTAIIPLSGLDFGVGMKQSVNQSEFLTLLSFHLERQFRGRMLIIPPFTYLQSEGVRDKVDYLLNWNEVLRENGTKYIFYLTCDSQWKSEEDKLGDQLIWVPSIPLEHLDENYKHSIMEDQVKQLLNILVQRWQQNT